jgi:hypothetical protein
MAITKTSLTVLLASFALAAQVQAQPFLTNKLVAYYQFSGNANDSSTNGHNGTLFGAATYGMDRFGNVSNCLSLHGGSGIGSGVDIPSLSNMPFQPVTYSAWFNLNSYLPNQTIAEMVLVGREQCGDQYGGAIALYSDLSHGITNQLMYNTGATGYVMNGIPPTNQWCQVVVTIDASGNPAIYFNGTNASAYGSAPNGTPVDFRIGAAAAGGCQSAPYFVFNGLLDDIRIYGTNLSAAQVQQLYQLEAPPCIVGVGATAVASVNSGLVVGANVTSGGSCYTNPPQVLFVGGGGTGATGTAIVTNGMVVGIIINTLGSGYTSAPTVYIGQTPLITQQPQSVVLNEGDTNIFNVVALGASMSYQWSFGGTNIPGATLTSLTITNIAQTNLGTYQVVVSNIFGAVTSSPTLLAMYPYLIAPFAGLDTLWGYTNTLSVGAWGSGPLDYQWFDNGIAITGATNASLTFTGIQPTNTGVYTVVVSNAYGAVTNAAEQVVVEPAGIALSLSPTITITGVVGHKSRRVAAIPSATVLPRSARALSGSAIGARFLRGRRFRCGAAVHCECVRQWLSDGAWS